MYWKCKRCWRITKNKYCKNHKCPITKCNKAPFIYDRYCVDHKCMSYQCWNQSMIGECFCMNHKCAITDCPNPSIVNQNISLKQELCKDHNFSWVLIKNEFKI
jgi:hypothetical protein